MNHATVTDPVEAAAERLDKCPNCHCESWKSLAVPGNWIGLEAFGDLNGRLGLVQCRNCQLEFANPRPSNDRLSSFYSGNTYVCHESAGSASAGAKATYLLDQMERHLPANTPRNLLDYGAGGGGFLCHARERGWNVRGFEPGRRGLESCRQAGLDATDQLDELPKSEFGLVTLHHVFEHLANPTEVLDGIRELLAPQGRLFVEVPNSRSLRARMASPLFARWFNADERYRAFPIHLFYYNSQTLKEVFNKAGWEVETTFTVGLGVDEFFKRSKSTSKPVSETSERKTVSKSRKPKLRHALRDAFLGLGIGENLAVIAYPKR